MRTGTGSGARDALAGGGTGSQVVPAALRTVLLALALLSGGPPVLLDAAGPAVIRGPYLQQVTEGRAVVRWRTDRAVESRLRFGTGGGRPGTVIVIPGLRTEHEVALTGLHPDTRYGYALATSDGAPTGPVRTFVTPAPQGSGRPVRAWVLGDSGTADSTARAVRDAFVAFAGGHPPDLVLMLGDNAYPAGTDLQYQRAVFDVFGEFLGRSPLWPVIGNHDAMSLDVPAGLGPYFDAFTLPADGEAGGVPSGTEAYYAFDHGAVHFVALDSSGATIAPGSPILAWLEADLAATTQPWVVALWHHPPYSRGSHDSDAEAELVAVRTHLLPILEAAGVDLVLTGHSHGYERSALVDGHYGPSDTFEPSMARDGGDGREEGTGPYDKPSGRTPHAGTVYIVAGSSGSVRAGPFDHPAIVMALAVAGSVVLDVDGPRLDARFLDQAGLVRDHFTIRKGSLGGPPAPGRLAARREGRSAIRLSWEDRSADELGFVVERSADGLAFQVAGTVGPGVTTFVDGPPGGDGPPGYYRVRALGPAGPSDPSNTASPRRPAPPLPSR